MIFLKSKYIQKEARTDYQVPLLNIIDKLIQKALTLFSSFCYCGLPKRKSLLCPQNLIWT